LSRFPANWEIDVRIVFHGENAATFSDGFADLLSVSADIQILPDVLGTEADKEIYQAADAIVGVKFDASLPQPKNLSLFHVPGAGYDAVDVSAVPGSAIICNCFGHEPAIAEYVMSAILARHVPLTDADAQLRKGQWHYWSGKRERAHGEIAGKTVGLLGFGHIGKAIARRAKAFDMRVSVANRSAVSKSDLVDESYGLDQLEAFFASSDFIIVSVPLTDDTRSIVDAKAFAAMRSDAVIFNVGRGATIDQQALYDALRHETIGGAVIDTWYAYPKAGELEAAPGDFPFHELKNIVMTPHMSGWTNGTVARRQAVIADNILRRLRGDDCINVVRSSTG
jgi:phosphoglycerate dehydrogenase-like enzyme